MDCLQRAQETSPDLVRETRVAAASVWDSLAEAADLRADVDKIARWVDGGCASQEAETELDVARRHIRDGEARIAKQEALIEALRLASCSTTKSELLLQVLKDALAQYRRRVALLVSTSAADSQV